MGRKKKGQTKLGEGERHSLFAEEREEGGGGTTEAALNAFGRGKYHVGKVMIGKRGSAPRRRGRGERKRKGSY